MDFTLRKYAEIIQSAKNSGYRLYNFGQWFEEKAALRKERQFLIRHDVDRQPRRALAMARLEREMGVSASYYFRAVRCSFRPEIIREIARLGHEIGYHYEDWHLAKYDREKAIGLYRKHLAALREIAPVRTIAMHGSPLAKESNLTIWKHYDLCQEGVLDVIRSYDFSDFAFFTDTGRTFAQSGANLRDYVGSKIAVADVATSDDLIAFIAAKRHDLIYFSVHPERWEDFLPGWAAQFARDKTINAIKHGLRLLRRGGNDMS